MMGATFNGNLYLTSVSYYSPNNASDETDNTIYLPLFDIFPNTKF